MRRSSHTSRNVHSIPIFNVKHTFFPSTISEWNKLYTDLCSSESLSILRKNILQFIRPAPNSVWNCYNSKGIKLIMWLWLGRLKNISSTIIFEIRLIPYAVVVMILNQNLNFFSTVPYLLMKEALSSAL